MMQGPWALNTKSAWSFGEVVLFAAAVQVRWALCSEGPCSDNIAGKQADGLIFVALRLRLGGSVGVEDSQGT
jgi:hypothetical protein